jgi:hypothetical protein
VFSCKAIKSAFRQAIPYGGQFWEAADGMPSSGQLDLSTTS